MAEYDLENLSVLVIDDNRHMRFLVKNILTALGIRDVREAENGAHGFKILKDFDPDIIVVDWRMKPIDGVEFTRQVRTGQDSQNIYVPIIMLTGHTEMARVMRARDAGVNEFLAKPVSAQQLYQRIRSIIDVPRQFIRTPNYFGPDRRRRNDPNYMGEERRKKE